MIIEFLISGFFTIVEGLIGVLPAWSLQTVDGIAGLGTILAYGLYFFPLDVWVVVMGQGAIMIGLTVAYTIAEWVWKKIPGIN